MLYSIFTNNSKFGGKFKKEFEAKLKTSDELLIANGYFGASIIEEFEDNVVSILTTDQDIRF